MAKQCKVLLLKDIEHVGRSGDISLVKPGYARNFLFPKKSAVIANKQACNMQAKLQEERAKQADVDKEQSEAVASRVDGITITTKVKIGDEGTMYGSVGAVDIVKLLDQEGLGIEKHNIILAHPIKKTGVYSIALRFKEGVEASFNLKVLSEDAEEETVEAETDENRSESDE